MKHEGRIPSSSPRNEDDGPGPHADHPTHAPIRNCSRQITASVSRSRTYSTIGRPSARVGAGPLTDDLRRGAVMNDLAERAVGPRVLAGHHGPVSLSSACIRFEELAVTVPWHGQAGGKPSRHVTHFMGTLASHRTYPVVTSIHTRIRDGDPDAFRHLFRSHAQLVHRYAIRATGDWATAEDVVSLTFLEAWRLRARLPEEPDGAKAWLMGIAVNVQRNTNRAARRHEKALARMPAKEVVPDIAGEVVGRMADAEQLTAAKNALGKLRRPEREVVTLCVWSGLSYAEAAEALGVAVGTVRSRLFRARERLRKLAEHELRQHVDETAARWPEHLHLHRPNEKWNR